MALTDQINSLATRVATEFKSIRTALTGKSDTGHTHSYAAVSHTHAQSDVTGLSTALSGKANTSHTHSATDITSGTLDQARMPRVLNTVRSVSYAATIAFDASVAGNFIDVTATGDITFDPPTNPVNRQVLQVAVLASGASRAITFAAGIDVLTGITRSHTVPSGEIIRFSLEYSTLTSAWTLTAVGMTGG